MNHLHIDETSFLAEQELIAGRLYGHKADMYGLGCLLFEMFTLR
jgi:hypothetical protein